MFREDEAAGQLQLIHQLEAGLRKQQQIIDAKDEVYESNSFYRDNDYNTSQNLVDIFAPCHVSCQERRHSSIGTLYMYSTA